MAEGEKGVVSFVRDGGVCDGWCIRVYENGGLGGEKMGWREWSEWGSNVEEGGVGERYGSRGNEKNGYGKVFGVGV
uniref:hypothetical protein n=1 Tax=Bacillus sp. WP8 TaxID=756828 RepID=UPI001C92EB01